jgi:hypothetical protein
VSVIERADEMFRAFKAYDEALEHAAAHLSPAQRWTAAPRLDQLYEVLVGAAHRYKAARDRGDA